MKIVRLKKSPRVYSCNSYLILGDWNRVEDLNTLIDPGTDDYVMAEIERASTGVGKVAVEQIILTHNHFDHSSSVMAFKSRYGARVLAFTEGPGVDELLHDGQLLKAADGFLEVIAMPGHSSDSICLYSPEARALFSGDCKLRVTTTADAHCRGYRDALLKLVERKIEIIYSGHDEPLKKGIREMLMTTLKNVRNSTMAGAQPELCRCSSRQ